MYQTRYFEDRQHLSIEVDVEDGRLVDADSGVEIPNMPLVQGTIELSWREVWRRELHDGFYWAPHADHCTRDDVRARIVDMSGHAIDLTDEEAEAIYDAYQDEREAV